jgi:DNA-binding NtrC family response regulator
MYTPIFVIESNDAVREAVYQMVRIAGFPCIAIADPSAALQVLLNIEFKVMITGMVANDLAIAPFVNAVKALQPKLRIIASNKYFKETKYSAVVDEYINFPFSLSELQCAIENVLQRNRTLPS